jgi:hypothetical protein
MTLGKNRVSSAVLAHPAPARSRRAGPGAAADLPTPSLGGILAAHPN